MESQNVLLRLIRTMERRAEPTAANWDSANIANKIPKGFSDTDESTMSKMAPIKNIPWTVAYCWKYKLNNIIKYVLMYSLFHIFTLTAQK